MVSKYPFKKNRMLSAVQYALLTGMCAMAASVQAAEQEEPEEEIEEIVVEGTRLQGSAQAVLEERKAQAFVADILGSESIARTGDNDAATALRRVTGLTLVDGRFIYIRGLGERYSSTQLNGSTVPSPDPTRAVIPLDLFPAGIIESLEVQKSFSPDLPANFGGGNVDIRTKSIPEDSVFQVRGTLGLNTNNTGSSPFYAGGGSRDNFGSDDGTRELPGAVRNALQGDGVEQLTPDEARPLLQSLNRNISSTPQSIDPNVSFGVNFGEAFDVGDESRFGFLSTVAYTQNWLASTERNVNALTQTQSGVGINEFEDGASTENIVRLSGMFNFGYEYDQNHKFEFKNIFLRDTRDRFRDRVQESTNSINEFLEENRVIDILYEERQLFTQQISGQHNFDDLYGIGVDWFYSSSTAERNAPGGFEALFAIQFEEGPNGTRINPVSQAGRQTPATYLYQELKDESENFGLDLVLPIYADNYTLELKGGVNVMQKDRLADAQEIDIQGFLLPNEFLLGDDFATIFSDEAIADPNFNIRLNDPSAPGDKFAAATTVDAYYLMADLDVVGEWRVTGGIRYEEFRQISVPFFPNTNRFSVEGDELADLQFEEFDLFPSAAVTYIVSDETQWRFNYSQTAIRPDLRDIASTFYIDPLTEFLVRGSTSLQSSTLDNFDVRWENYYSDGDNFSVAFFYKDIDKPIEQIELPSIAEGAPQLLTANAESGELYGIEVEFLNSLTFLGDEWANYYVSGNVTISDSEVNIGLDGDPNTTSLFESQLQEALDTTQPVTEVITNNRRRLIGHSEWVLNLQFGWDSLDNEHSATLVYNVFGDRIIIPGVNGFEDGKEEPFHSVDLVYNYYPTFDSTVRVRVQNILDEEREIIQEGIAILREDVGTVISVTYSVDF